MFDITKKPFIIFWELTRACLLACKHCRAKAQTKRHPDELSTRECYGVVEQILDFKKPYPLVIITGGDPLMRDDLFDIIDFMTSNGLRVAIAFSGTKLATKDKLEKMRSLGVSRIAISIDGSNPDIHDYFRGKTGTFEKSLEIIKDARDVDLPVQINTTVTNYNIPDLPNIMKLCIENEVVLWDVFFLVPTGRARADIMPSAQEFEDVLCWLYDVNKETPLNIKSSAACHLRRIEHMRDKGIYDIKLGEVYYKLRDKLESLERELGFGDYKGDKEIVTGAYGRSMSDGIRRMTGITDGRGMMFISHIGEVYPSGFLPLTAGNIREQTLEEIYINSRIFRDLKDPNNLKGKCGICEYRFICGGSRARAYAMTGDYLAQEPRCVYVPKQKRDQIPNEPKGL